MIKVPEVILKQEFEIIIKRYYDDYVAKENDGSVVDASDVDSGVTFAITQQGATGIAETTVVTVPDASAISSKHWLINTPTRQFYVWYNVDGENSVDPSLIDRVAIQVDVDLVDADTVVSTKTRTAIAAQSDYFTAIVGGADVTINCVETDKTRRSLVYQMFGDLSFDGMNYSAQLATMIKARYESEARNFVINLGYNKNREAFPQISILLPSEENSPKYTGVLQGEQNFKDGTYADLNTHNYQTTYTLFITSDNYNEVIILYHFFKTIILVGQNQFTCRGLENIWTSGRDITMDFDIDPTILYHRTVAISFFYENTVPSLVGNDSVSGIIFAGTPTP